jgi:tRNA (guanine37-N1)-methyltransferase
VLAAYTELRNAQKVKDFLINKKLIHQDFLVVKELDKIYFPMASKMKVPGAKVVNTRFEFPEKLRTRSLEEILQKKLTQKQIEMLPKSQEIVGSILILEIPDELRKKEKMIAEAYLAQHKNVETVVRKDKIHSGKYRTRTVRIIAGKKSKETIHYENGVRIKLHLEKVYFSARTANERLRVARQVKGKEEVLVMFSGVAPLPLVIAKNSEANVWGVEMNPLAHQYARQNVLLNKFSDRISLFQGDVTKVMPKWRRKFDRIAMPLPKTGAGFLNLALSKLKKGGVVHLYAFLAEKDIVKEAKHIKEMCGKKVRVLRKVKCGQFSPKTFRVCFDLKVN